MYIERDRYYMYHTNSIYLSISLSLSMYIYIYIYYVCIHLSYIRHSSTILPP